MKCIFLLVLKCQKIGAGVLGGLLKKMVILIRNTLSIPIVVVEMARIALSRDTEFACIEIYIFTCFAFH